MDLQHFDIAHYAGHRAIAALARAYAIYVRPVATALQDNQIRVDSFDFKPVSDIANLSARQAVQDLDVGAAEPMNAFHWSGFLRMLRTKEAEHCINAVIFFQVMMEAVINDHLGPKVRKPFAAKWRSVLWGSGASQADIDNFDAYLNGAYERMRNKVVHGSTRTGAIDASCFNFAHLHEHLKRGWFAYVFLLNHQHNAAMDYEENWRTMANAHGVPAVIDPGAYPDLGTLGGQMLRKHLDHLNAGR